MWTLILALVFAGADPKAEFDKAAADLAAGNLAAAEAGFRSVLASSPNHIGALGNLGVVYSRQERYADAVRVYEQALRMEPKNKHLLLNLGLGFFKQERFDEAASRFERVLELDRTHAQARELLATCQLALGRAQYEAARFEEAAALLERARDNRPTPEIRRELGKAYVSLRRNDEARAELKIAMEADRRDPEPPYYLGSLLVQEGEDSAAVPLLETARRLNPEFWGVYYYLGRALLAKGDDAAAIPLFQRAIALNPSEAAPYYNLARALKSAGRDEEARQALKRVAELKDLANPTGLKKF
jgi:tetratricopeptide (TPR) repeat protein